MKRRSQGDQGQAQSNQDHRSIVVEGDSLKQHRQICKTIADLIKPFLKISQMLPQDSADDREDTANNLYGFVYHRFADLCKCFELDLTKLVSDYTSKQSGESGRLPKTKRDSGRNTSPLITLRIRTCVRLVHRLGCEIDTLQGMLPRPGLLPILMLHSQISESFDLFAKHFGDDPEETRGKSTHRYRRPTKKNPDLSGTAEQHQLERKGLPYAGEIYDKKDPPEKEAGTISRAQLLSRTFDLLKPQKAAVTPKKHVAKPLPVSAKTSDATATITIPRNLIDHRSTQEFEQMLDQANELSGDYEKTQKIPSDSIRAMHKKYRPEDSK